MDEPIDYDQYGPKERPGPLDDPVVVALLTMPTANMNEAGFMLHMAPRIATHLREQGLVVMGAADETSTLTPEEGTDQ